MDGITILNVTEVSENSTYVSCCRRNSAAFFIS